MTARTRRPGLRRRGFMDRRGSMTILGAAFLTVIVFLSSLTIQTDILYVTQQRMQRVADLANLAAAATASPISGGGASATAIATALNVATVNGFGTATITTTAASLGNGSYAMTTTITDHVTLIFGTALGVVSSPVKAISVVEITPTVYSDCVAALSGSIQMTTSQGWFSGTSCGIGAQTDIAMNGSSIDVGSAAVGYPAYQAVPAALGLSWNSSNTPSTSSWVFNATTTDTLASNTSIAAIESHLAGMATWPYVTTIPVSPTSPSVTAGTNETYSGANGYPTTATLPESTKYGNLTVSYANVTFSGNNGTPDPNCHTPTTISGTVSLLNTNDLMFNTGCYVFAGPVALNNSYSSNTFSIASGAQVTFVFESTVQTNAFGYIVFSGGSATYSFAGNITTNGGGFIGFGNGSKAFGSINVSPGAGTIYFSSGPNYFSGTTIQGATGTLVFGTGPSYFWNASVDNTGAGTVEFGNGPFYFYNSSIINGTTAAGYLSFGDGPFYLYNTSLTTGASSATLFGLGNMDFYGAGSSISIGAATTFGSDGSASTGSGLVSLYGGSLTVSGGSLTAQGVTFALSSGSVTITAPLNAEAPTSSSPSYGYQNILFVLESGGITFSGAQSNLSGVIYAPSSTITIESNAGVEGWLNNEGCIVLAASNVVISGYAGSDIAPCSGLMPTSTGTAVSLYQ